MRDYNNVMKKFFVLVLVLTFVLFSCDDESMNTDNPFVGTWENESNGYRIGFTKTVATGYYPNGDIYWTGTYTYNDTHITIELDQAVSAQDMIEAWGDSRMIPYSIEGDILRFNYGNLTKIKE